MCLECHSHLSDSDVITQLRDSLTGTDFEWNSTSLFHIYLAASGINGYEAQAVAFELLEKYIKWIKENPTWNRGFVLQRSCSIEDIETTTQKLKAAAAENRGKLNQEQIKNRVFESDYLGELVVYNEVY